MARRRVVIVGGGFAGLNAARALRKLPVDITLVDRTNHHLFQPLLYQVATAGLSPADIASPIRSVLRRQNNLEVLMSEVGGVRPHANQVLLKEGPLQYDYLVLATGSRHSYFGHPEWEDLAPGLKSIEDATRTRAKVLTAFEKAELGNNHDIGEGWLTFVIVGGGPTGVELAGSIGELARRTLAKDFEHISPEKARVLLVEAGPRILPAFDEDLASKARRFLHDLGVEVLESTAVQEVASWGVKTTTGEIHSRTIIWAAGVQASPAAEWLGVEADRAGRVKVQPDLSVPGYHNIFVLGDTALNLDAEGKPLPGIAPVAMQQGRYVAKAIRARLEGRSADPFRYFDKGSLATIGRSKAIAQIGRLRVAGWTAWLIWLFVHIMYLATVRNRLTVLVQWAWAYVTWERGARLITSTTTACEEEAQKSTGRR